MRNYLIRIVFAVSLTVFSFISINAQTYEYPDNIFGFSRFPEYEKTKGIRTILYVQQRGDHVFETKTETFDKDGKKIEEITQNAGIEAVHSGKMVRLGDKTVYVYDAAGRLAKTVSYNPEGKVFWTEINKFDEKNLLIEQISYNETGNKIREWKYVRNAEKREVESGGMTYGTPNEKNIFVFDNKGFCTKKIEYKKGGSIDTTNVFEYNDKGYISKYTKTNDSSYGYTYEYKYDLKGNWIERQTFYFQEEGNIENDPHMSEYRMISYYDDEKTAKAHTVK